MAATTFERGPSGRKLWCCGHSADGRARAISDSPTFAIADRLRMLKRSCPKAIIPHLRASPPWSRLGYVKTSCPETQATPASAGLASAVASLNPRMQARTDCVRQDPMPRNAGHTGICRPRSRARLSNPRCAARMHFASFGNVRKFTNSLAVRPTSYSRFGRGLRRSALRAARRSLRHAGPPSLRGFAAPPSAAPRREYGPLGDPRIGLRAPPIGPANSPVCGKRGRTQ